MARKEASGLKERRRHAGKSASGRYVPGLKDPESKIRKIRRNGGRLERLTTWFRSAIVLKY
jgi:hypothetical protein